MQPQGKEGGGRKGCGASSVRGKKSSAKGCFAAGCDCVCIKKVATTGTSYKHLKGGYSRSLCVDLCPSRGCWFPMPSTISQPRSDTACPCGLFVRKCFRVAMCRKKGILNSPSLNANAAPKKPLTIFMGHWFSCFVVEESSGAYPEWQPLLG